MEELDGTEKSTLKIFKNITLIHEAGMVLLEVPAALLTQDFKDFALFKVALPPSFKCPVSLYVLCQWIANPLNDMYADAVTTVVLEVQSNPKAQKGWFW